MVGQVQLLVAEAVVVQLFSVAVSVTVCPDGIPTTLLPETVPLSADTVAPVLAVKVTE